MRVSNCTKSTDEATIHVLTLSPASPEQLGQNFTISGEGEADVDITDSTFYAVAKSNGFPLFKTSGDACKPDEIKLPLDVGVVYFPGIKCPYKKGTDLIVPITAKVSPTAPNGEVKISLTVVDNSTDVEVFCVDTIVDIGIADLY